ncbi:MAG: hypothetical protein IKC95_01330 [Oscillospiraceae bacterium]|nr:hypothetical protein [Oscillospiraceae bacterium]
MDSRKIVFKETAVILLGEIICVSCMLGIYALLGYFSNRVLLGGIIGGGVTVLNYFFMAIGASLAADKAQTQDVKGGKAILQLSMLLRYVIVFVILFAFAKSGLCAPIALVLPLIFVRPIMLVDSFFRRKGEMKQ